MLGVLDWYQKTRGCGEIFINRNDWLIKSGETKIEVICI